MLAVALPSEAASARECFGDVWIVPAAEAE
jgi:hypothetical protein